MNIRYRAAFALLAALLCAPPAVAQKVTAPANNGASMPGSAICYGALGAVVTCVDASNPLPVSAPVVGSASSTPQLGTVTSSAVTPSSGTASFSAGTATIGPLTPQLGRDLRVILTGTWSGSIYIGTSVNGCTTVNPLTIAGSSWGSFTGNANEVVDTPTISGVVYCAVATVTSGTLNYGVRQ